MLPSPNIALMAVYVRIVLTSLGLVSPEIFKEGVSPGLSGKIVELLVVLAQSYDATYRAAK